MTIPIDPIGAGQVGVGFLKYGYNWWRTQRPINRVLGDISNPDTATNIFIRDLIIPPGSALISHDSGRIGHVPNVHELWPRVEGISLAYILNVLGQVGKTRNINVIEMSKDHGSWNGNVIVLGAQAQKCFDFYKQMENVAYVMDPELRHTSNGQPVPREHGFGYGMILKTRNPHSEGVGLLIGGYGVLGTEAAGHYFLHHCADLGRRFGKKCFGVIVPASVTAGIESTERLERYDKEY
jgi:hypothetical protein